MNGIPLPEFAKMLHEAQEAFENSDLTTALQINERLTQYGYSLMVNEGRLRLDNRTLPKAAEYTLRERQAQAEQMFAARQALKAAGAEGVNG